MHELDGRWPLEPAMGEILMGVEVTTGKLEAALEEVRSYLRDWEGTRARGSMKVKARQFVEK